MSRNTSQKYLKFGNEEEIGRIMSRAKSAKGAKVDFDKRG